MNYNPWTLNLPHSPQLQTLPLRRRLFFRQRLLNHKPYRGTSLIRIRTLPRTATGPSTVSRVSPTIHASCACTLNPNSDMPYSLHPRKLRCSQSPCIQPPPTLGSGPSPVDPKPFTLDPKPESFNPYTVGKRTLRARGFSRTYLRRGIVLHPKP